MKKIMIAPIPDDFAHDRCVFVFVLFCRSNEALQIGFVVIGRWFAPSSEQLVTRIDKVH